MKDRHLFYRLNAAKEAVPCTVEEWRDGFLDRPRVGHTEIGDVEVSTIFLGLDHRHVGEGPPLLFETFVFGGPLDSMGRRCSTWAEAEAQHAAMLAQVRAGLN